MKSGSGISSVVRTLSGEYMCVICIINNVFVVDYDTNNTLPLTKLRQDYRCHRVAFSTNFLLPFHPSRLPLPCHPRIFFLSHPVVDFARSTSRLSFYKPFFSIKCFKFSPTPQVDFIAGMHRLPRLPDSSSSSSSSLKDFHLESTPHVCHLLHLLQFKSLTLCQVLRKRYNVSKVIVSRYMSQISPDYPSYTNQHFTPQVGSASNNSQAVFAALGQHFTQVSTSLFQYCIPVPYVCRTFDRICCSWILMNFGR